MGSPVPSLSDHPQLEHLLIVIPEAEILKVL